MSIPSCRPFSLRLSIQLSSTHFPKSLCGTTHFSRLGASRSTHIPKRNSRQHPSAAILSLSFVGMAMLAVPAAATTSMIGMLKGLSLTSSSGSSYMTGDANKFGAVVVERRSSSGLVEQQNGGAITIEAAHKKGSGSTKNGRDSKPKMLGVKIYGDQAAQPGAIIVRQRGTKVL